MNFDPKKPCESFQDKHGLDMIMDSRRSAPDWDEPDYCEEDEDHII